MNGKLMVLLAAGGVVLLAQDSPKKEANELEKLKAKVSVLEGRIALLENKVLGLSGARRTGFPGTTIVGNPAEAVPPNVGEIEVNGVTVYKVPLAGSSGSR